MSVRRALSLGLAFSVGLIWANDMTFASPQKPDREPSKQNQRKVSEVEKAVTQTLKKVAESEKSKNYQISQETDDAIGLGSVLFLSV